MAAGHPGGWPPGLNFYMSENLVRNQIIKDHYARPDLIEAILDGIRKLGKSPQTVTTDDLAAVDEFHIGGLAATRSVIEQLHLGPADHVLDVGCGLGGTARFIAKHAGCRVTGVDLTADYVEVGAAICRWMGLDQHVFLQCASALAMPFADRTFSAASMLHVGMNVEDKAKLFAEVGRVLEVGGKLALYDVMREAEGELTYPLPWATTPVANALASAAEYRHALTSAGFRVLTERDRKAFALEYFAQQQARTSGLAPPLGLHLLMGERRREQVHNMIASLASGLLAPFEIVAEKI